MLSKAAITTLQNTVLKSVSSASRECIPTSWTCYGLGRGPPGTDCQPRACSANKHGFSTCPAQASEAGVPKTQLFLSGLHPLSRTEQPMWPNISQTSQRC